jgi:hypothetical protein
MAGPNGLERQGHSALASGLPNTKDTKEREIQNLWRRFSPSRIPHPTNYGKINLTADNPEPDSPQRHGGMEKNNGHLQSSLHIFSVDVLREFGTAHLH